MQIPMNIAFVNGPTSVRKSTHPHNSNPRPKNIPIHLSVGFIAFLCKINTSKSDRRETGGAPRKNNGLDVFSVSSYDETSFASFWIFSSIQKIAENNKHILVRGTRDRIRLWNVPSGRDRAENRFFSSTKGNRIRLLGMSISRSSRELWWWQKKNADKGRTNASHGAVFPAKENSDSSVNRSRTFSYNCISCVAQWLKCVALARNKSIECRNDQ
jgi:hypothetical protein